MPNGPAEFEILRLDRGDLERVLAEFEDRYEEETGKRLSSAAFYERYCAGEFDGPFGLVWSTYYEAFARPDPVEAISEAVRRAPVA